MVGNAQATKGRECLPKDDVTSGLVIDLITDSRKCLDCLFTGNDRQLGHIATSIISSEIPGGTGSLCFLRLNRYPRMASSILTSASRRGFPLGKQTGRAGASGIKNS